VSDKKSTQTKSARQTRSVPVAESKPDSDAPGSLKGSYLIDAIAHEAVIQGVELLSLYDRFGFTETYWKAIVLGHRSISNAAQARLELIADFLNRPLIQVLNLAEVLEPRHFFAPGTIDDDLSHIYKAMLEDRAWGSFVIPPDRWDVLDRDVKILIAMLYQGATSRDLKAKFAIAEINRSSLAARPSGARPSSGDSSKPSKPAKKASDRARRTSAEAVAA
jgi:hypothetical protein